MNIGGSRGLLRGWVSCVAPVLGIGALRIGALRGWNIGEYRRGDVTLAGLWGYAGLTGLRLDLGFRADARVASRCSSNEK